MLPVRVLNGYRDWRFGPAWQEYSAIRPEFARKIHLNRMVYAANHDPRFEFRHIRDPRELRYKLIEPGRSQAGSIWGQLGAFYDMRVVDPTFDRRVMELCIGIPDHLYLQGEHDRMVLRRAMDGLIAPETLWQQRRGIQAADIIYRLRTGQDEIQSVLRGMKQSPLSQDIFDLPRLQALLDGIATTENISETQSVLMRSLQIGLLLEQLG
jgi:asparagine synthase (glutamine-hydrolysing)